MNWTRMNQAEKKRYDHLVQKDRLRYDEKYMDYKNNIQMDIPESQAFSTVSETFSELDNGYVMNRSELNS